MVMNGGELAAGAGEGSGLLRISFTTEVPNGALGGGRWQRYIICCWKSITMGNACRWCNRPVFMVHLILLKLPVKKIQTLWIILNQLHLVFCQD
jgi:hypothetical protein